MKERVDPTARPSSHLNNEHRTGGRVPLSLSRTSNRDVQFCPSHEDYALSFQHAQHSNRNLQHSTGYFRGESGLPIFYSRWRPVGSARGAVLILHGLGEHSGRYRHLVGALHQAGYLVYAHDHQGFGRSGGARLLSPGLPRLPEWRNTGPVYGSQGEPRPPWSVFTDIQWAGLIGLLYLMEAPGAADLAVIASPSLQSHDLSPVNRVLKRILELTHRVRPQLTFRQRGSLDILSRDWEEVQIAMRDSLGVPLRSARWVVEFFETMQEVSERANEVRLPILMMQGLADAVVVPSATQEFFAKVGSEDKSLRLYEGYYHELHNDLGRERPIGAVLDWLSARCPDPGNP